ncbi:MAG TPA: hypothetical protein VG652_10995 [Gaiellaceae bacterium]|nr:hypothetical protein [Gaiellaceae bacterium]
MHVRLRLTIALVLVAGGTVIAAVSFWPPENDKAAGCSSVNAVPLTAQGQQALDSLKTSIRYEIAKSSDGTRQESWTDPVTGQSRTLSFDAQGRLIGETGSTWDGKTVRSVTVTFATRSWMSATTTAPHAYTSTDVSSAGGSLAVRQAIAGGTATTLGPAIAEGRTTLRLREQPVELWVDPLTYLPVQTRLGAVTTAISWLPRTASNLLSTTIVIPQGFKQSPSGPGSLSTNQWTTPATCAQS